MIYICLLLESILDSILRIATRAFDKKRRVERTKDTRAHCVSDDRVRCNLIIFNLEDQNMESRCEVDPEVRVGSSDARQPHVRRPERTRLGRALHPASLEYLRFCGGGKNIPRVGFQDRLIRRCDDIIRS